MRTRFLLILGLALAGTLGAPRPSGAWVNGGLGIGYGGGYPCPPGVYAPFYPSPVFYPPPVFFPAACCGPGVFWPGYGPDVAVRWNRYFDPRAPRIQGYTLPR